MISFVIFLWFSIWKLSLECPFLEVSGFYTTNGSATNLTWTFPLPEDKHILSFKAFENTIGVENNVVAKIANDGKVVLIGSPPVLKGRIKNLQVIKLGWERMISITIDPVLATDQCLTVAYEITTTSFDCDYAKKELMVSTSPPYITTITATRITNNHQTCILVHFNSWDAGLCKIKYDLRFRFLNNSYLVIQRDQTVILNCGDDMRNVTYVNVRTVFKGLAGEYDVQDVRVQSIQHGDGGHTDKRLLGFPLLISGAVVIICLMLMVMVICLKRQRKGKENRNQKENRNPNHAYTDIVDTHLLYSPSDCSISQHYTPLNPLEIQQGQYTTPTHYTEIPHDGDIHI